jgi:DnaJ-class molecular chaperone
VEYRTVSPEEMEKMFGSTAFSDFFHDLFGAPPAPPEHRPRASRANPRGQDVEVEVRVPLHLAIAGGKVEMSTPRGTRVHLTVPPATQNGRVLRLRGQGMPSARGGGAGDLLARITVELPIPPDSELRAWAEGRRRPRSG